MAKRITDALRKVLKLNFTRVEFKEFPTIKGIIRRPSLAIVYVRAEGKPDAVYVTKWRKDGKPDPKTAVKMDISFIRLGKEGMIKFFTEFGKPKGIGQEADITKMVMGNEEEKSSSPRIPGGVAKFNKFPEPKKLVPPQRVRAVTWDQKKQDDHMNKFIKSLKGYNVSISETDTYKLVKYTKIEVEA